MTKDSRVHLNQSLIAHQQKCAAFVPELSNNKNSEERIQIYKQAFSKNDELWIFLCDALQKQENQALEDGVKTVFRHTTRNQKDIINWENAFTVLSSCLLEWGALHRELCPDFYESSVYLSDLYFLDYRYSPENRFSFAQQNQFQDKDQVKNFLEKTFASWGLAEQFKRIEFVHDPQKSICASGERIQDRTIAKINLNDPYGRDQIDQLATLFHETGHCMEWFGAETRAEMPPLVHEPYSEIGSRFFEWLYLFEIAKNLLNAEQQTLWGQEVRRQWVYSWCASVFSILFEWEARQLFQRGCRDQVEYARLYQRLRERAYGLNPLYKLEEGDFSFLYRDVVYWIFEPFKLRSYLIGSIYFPALLGLWQGLEDKQQFLSLIAPTKESPELPAWSAQLGVPLSDKTFSRKELIRIFSFM